MTHSHDTATPALSVESEYALVPREPTREMMHGFLRAGPMPAVPFVECYRAMIAAAPAPTPSPAAKSVEAGTYGFGHDPHDQRRDDALATPSPQPAYADALLSTAEQKAQGKRCACLGADEWCPCQNTPDRKTAIERREKSRA